MNDYVAGFQQALHDGMTEMKMAGRASLPHSDEQLTIVRYDEYVALCAERDALRALIREVVAIDPDPNRGWTMRPPRVPLALWARLQAEAAR